MSSERPPAERPAHTAVAPYGANHGAVALATLGQIFAPLLPPGCALAFRDPRAEQDDLFAAERAAVASAVPRRIAEFAAGRAAARQALALLGHPPAAIPRGIDRAPVWPDGIIGSISHCESVAVAVLACRSSGLAALGIDIEPAEPLDADLVDTICSPAESAQIAALGDPGLYARVVFSIKECLYKAQFPSTGRMLEFEDIAVVLDAKAGRFSGELQGFGDPIEGRFAIAAGYILSLASVTDKASDRRA